ncbi:MAG: cadmium-translocating P-type ATPase [Deferribacteraceae bacterium]|jgi:Cd2+/Zn2+-exporting ATPase|nr:cadmium-translocating P-type ATPase [Deferribacteraceae bacterium]
MKIKVFIDGLRDFFLKDRLSSAGIALFIIGLAAEQGGLSKTTVFGVFLASYILIGRSILKKTFKNILKGKVFDENFLMSIASIGAFCLGFYSEAAGVILFYVVGEYFQEKASDNAERSIEAMLSHHAEKAVLATEEGNKVVEPRELSVGDIVIVAPGEKVPIDGVVISGISSMTTSALTGETEPTAVEPGSAVLAGFINGSGLITIEAAKKFDDTVYSKVVAMVKEAGGKKAATEKFITSFARVYTPAVVSLAFITAIIPPIILGEGFYLWIYRALVLLVVSCPCALLISVPLSFFAGIGGAAKNGIFVKGGEYLEALARVGSVVFDKTGTLTTGEFSIQEMHPMHPFNEYELLRFAAYAEAHSTHPAGRCIVKEFKKRFPTERLDIEFQDYQELPGQGVSVKFEGRVIHVGKQRYIEGLLGAEVQNNSHVYVVVDGVLAGGIRLTDDIRDLAKNVLKNLKGYGAKLYMLSGDSFARAAQVAEELELDGFSAEMLPADKLEKLLAFQSAEKKDKRTVYVGDGINDAPALRSAAVGVAMGGSGSQSALEAADIVLTNDDLSKLPTAIRIARKTRKTAYQNIVGSVGIKLIVIIITMTVNTAAIQGLWLAIFADVGASLLAILNSLRVLRS